MSRVFLSFFSAISDQQNPQAIPVFYEAFVQGLIKNGNDVLVYLANKWGGVYPKYSEEFISKLKEFNPDLIICFNNNCYDIGKDFDCPIIVYEVDSVSYYGNKDVLKKNPERYLYVVPQTDSIQHVVDELHVKKNKIFYIPFFSEVYPEKVKQDKNIVFIGSKFSTSLPHAEFIKSNPTNEERKEFKNVLDKFCLNPFVDVHKLKKEISSEKIRKMLDFTYISNPLSDIKRMGVLSQVGDLGLHIYGNKNWLQDTQYMPEIILNYYPQKVYSLKDNQDLYNSAKIGININHLQATSGFSWRVCDVMASNACLVSEYAPDFKKLFPKINLPMFENKYEAREVCQKLLNNENMRKDIVLECQNVVNENYRFIHCLRKIEEITNLKLCHEQGQNTLTFMQEKSMFSKNSSHLVSKDSSKDNSKAPVCEKSKMLCLKSNISFKNKIRYKIWKHLNKKLKKKGIIQ